MKDYTENISKKDIGYGDLKKFEKFRNDKMEQYSCLNTEELLSKKQQLQVHKYYKENINVFSLSRDGLSILTVIASIAATVAALEADINLWFLIGALLVEVALFSFTIVFCDVRREKKRLLTCAQCKIAIQCIDEILEKHESYKQANEAIDISDNTEDIKQFVVTLKEKK